MMTTIRVWDDKQGWVHEVQWKGITVDRNKHLDILQSRYPLAQPSGVVVCGDVR